MVEKILRAKHWQIFLLVSGIPYSLQIITLIMIKNDFGKMSDFIPFIQIVFFLALFGWFFAIATGLNKIIPEGVKMKMTKFKIFIIIPMLYIPAAFGILSTLAETMASNDSGVMLGITVAIMFPLHILSMFGLIYSFYFVAKIYKTVELQREVTFSYFANEFFMFLFFPVGVWLLQPKINKLIELTEKGLDGVTGVVEYPEEFNG